MINHRDVRVLIAEDDHLVSEMIKGVLEDVEYNVVAEAADGAEAVEMTQLTQPDVVLMDVKMPIMNGIEATRQIHASCPTPVVLLTAYETPELVQQASVAGAGAYLVKPSSAREIERAITVAMARFHDMMELQRLNVKLQEHDEVQKKATQLSLIGQVTQKITTMLDLDELLLQVVHLIGDTFGYYITNVTLVESDELVLKACSGPLGKTLVDRTRFKIGRDGVAGQVAHSGEPLLVNDVSREPDRNFAKVSQNTRSELAVPIKFKGEIIGVLDVQSTETGAFGNDDVFILQTLADQLAIAIENARLYRQTDKELQARVSELSALYAIAKVMNHSLDLDSILQLVLDRAIGVLGMDAGGILLLDPPTGEILLRAHREWSPELIKVTSRSRADEGLMPHMLESVIVIEDPSQLSKDRRVVIEQEGFQSIVSIPLKAKESTLGVMGITSRNPRNFGPGELELLATIGNQVGMAIDRASLQAQELKVAILEERQAMARQMHDDIAQTLGYLGLQMDGVMNSSSLAQNVGVQTDLEEIRKDIEGAYERVRDSIIRLREDVPDHFDLGAALQKSISAFKAQTRCKVNSKLDEARLLRLSPSASFQAIYIIHEALANARKHSNADIVHLTCQDLGDDMIEIIVQDNGRGFDLDLSQQSSCEGLGLRFMKERAERAGGSLRIKTQPGQGVQVAISLPSSQGGEHAGDTGFDS